MKTLSIQQPYASLICAGIKDVENRTWKPKENPGRILIHASKKCPRNIDGILPVEQSTEVVNHIVKGDVMNYPDMPSGAIIGYVELADVVTKSNSIWTSGGEDVYKWVLKNAYVFNEPITGVKGKLHLFDYDLDENNLPPAHKVELKVEEYNDGVVTLPMNDNEFKYIEEDNIISYELAPCGSANILCQENTWDPKPVHTLIITNNGKQRTFEVKEATTGSIANENGEPYQFPSLSGGLDYRYIIQLELGKELNKDY